MSFTTKKRCIAQVNDDDESVDFSDADLLQMDNAVKLYQSPKVKRLCMSQHQVPTVTPTTDTTRFHNKALDESNNKLLTTHSTLHHCLENYTPDKKIILNDPKTKPSISST